MAINIDPIELEKLRGTGLSDAQILDALTAKTGKTDVITSLRATGLDDTRILGMLMAVKKESGVLKQAGRAAEFTAQEAFRPLAELGETFPAEVKEAIGLIGKGVKEPSWKSAYRIPLGLLQLGWSPIGSTSKEFVYDPAMETMEPFIGKPYADVIAQTLRGLSEVLPWGKIVMGARAAKDPILAGTRQLEKRVGKKAIRESQEELFGSELLGAEKSFNHVLEPGKWVHYDQATKKYTLLDNATPHGTRMPIAKEITEQEARALVEGGMKLRVGFEPIKTVADDIMRPEFAGKAFEPRLKAEIVRQINDAGELALAGNLDASKSVSRNIATLLGMGELEIETLPAILKTYKISPEQFAQEFLNTASYFGRGLGSFGIVAKRLKKIYKDNPLAIKAFDEAIAGIPLGSFEATFDTLIRTGQTIENTRRAMLVGQAATALRNLWSQNIRTFLGITDEALQGAIRGTVGGQGKALQQTLQGLGAFQAFVTKLRPAERKQFLRILNDSHGVIHKARLASVPVHEVGMGKVASLVNTLNRGQEMFFRHLAFEAKLRVELAKQGLDFATVNPKKIPLDTIKTCVDYALEMTFAASPKSRAFLNFIKFWSGTPLSTINPFPRFGLYNAPKFLFEHSPLGYLEGFHPETIKALASGNPEVFAKAVSRATIGTLMLASAWSIRSSEYAGEKWYEINIGDKTYDMRPYAPFSTYLFIAECFRNPDNIKAVDFAQAAIGLNRVAGTGLVVVDWMREKRMFSVKALERFLGQYMGSFTVPARTPKDILGAFSEEERKWRDTADHPLLGPSMQNLPLVSQLLEERPSPVTPKRPEQERWVGLSRQTTGLGFRVKSPVEKELDALGLRLSDVLSSSGVPEADRILAAYMAPKVDVAVGFLVSQPQWSALSKPQRIEALLGRKGVITILRANARRKLAETHPELALQMTLKGWSQNRRELLKEELAK